MELRDESGRTEEEFLASYSPKDYPRPSLTADIVIYDKDTNSVLLIKRKGHPYLGHYAFPGGFANPGETIEETAKRELEEETNVNGLELIPIGLFTKPGRDPRGWTVSQAFLSVVSGKDIHPEAGDDAAETEWFEISQKDDTIILNGAKLSLKVDKEKSDLAFDHGDILRSALSMINKNKETEGMELCTKL